MLRSIVSNPSDRSGDGVSLNAPFGHGAEEVVFSGGVRLDFAPFCVVAEVQDAEVVYGFLDAAAGADEKDARGFCDCSDGTVNRILGHVHGGF
jgi:hypothetical protein